MLNLMSTLLPFFFKTVSETDVDEYFKNFKVKVLTIKSYKCFSRIFILIISEDKHSMKKY